MNNAIGRTTLGGLRLRLRPPLRPSLAFGLLGWLVALLLLASSALAQSPTTSPLYVACVTTTPSTTPLPSSTLPPTMTTIPIASPSPTLNGLFQTATAMAIASPTPFVFNTPTIDVFTDTPTPSITGARYQVVSAAGVNVRAAAGTNQPIISSLYSGQVVIIGEMSLTYVDGWRWGKVGNGWVAMVSEAGAVLLRAVP